MAAIDWNPLALVTVRRSKERPVCGTGYLIAPNLVLTARHVVTSTDQEEPDSIRVCFSGTLEDERWIEKPSKWYEGAVFWQGDGNADLALVELDCDPPLSHGPLLSFVGPSANQEWQSRGFPLGGLIDGARSSIDFWGRTGPINRGRFDVGVDAGLIAGSDYAGLSGSPVFVKELLVGVLVEVANRFAGRLQAVSVASLLVDEKVRDRVTAPAVEARRREVEGRIRHLLEPHPAVQEALVRELKIPTADSAAIADSLLTNLPRGAMLQSIDRAHYSLLGDTPGEGDRRAGAVLIRILEHVIGLRADRGLVTAYQSQAAGSRIQLDCAFRTVAELARAGAEGTAARLEVRGDKGHPEGLNHVPGPARFESGESTAYADVLEENLARMLPIPSGLSRERKLITINRILEAHRRHENPDNPASYAAVVEPPPKEPRAVLDQWERQLEEVGSRFPSLHIVELLGNDDVYRREFDEIVQVLQRIYLRQRKGMS